MSKYRNKAIWLSALAAVMTLFGAVWGYQSVYATASTYNADVVKKALLTGVQYCYSQGAIQEKVDAISGFSSFTSLIVGGTNENFIALPTGLTNIDDNGVSCEQLFIGYSGAFGIGGSFEGVFDIFGKSPSASSKEAKTALLEGMGYKMIESSNPESGKNCVSFKYNEQIGNYSSPKEVETDQVCAEMDGNKIASLSTNKSTASYYGASSTYNPPSAFLGVTEDGKVELLRARTTRTEHGYTVGTTTYVTSAGVGSTWDEFVTNLRQTLSSAGDGNGNFSFTHGAYGSSVTIKYGYIRSSDEGDSNYNESDIGDVAFELAFTGSEDQLRITSGRATKYLSNGAYPLWSSLEFSDAEKLQLLALSLQNWFFAGVDPSEYWACDVADWADYGSFTTKIGITSGLGRPSSECRLNTGMATNPDSSINGFTSIDGREMFDASGATKLTLQQTIDEINRLAGELPEDEDLTPDTSLDTGVSNGSDDTVAPCYEAAGALGWIMCPVVGAVSEAADGIYGSIEKDFLMVSPDEVGGSGASSGWEIFRNFANLIFVILFIIVILSQVTGIGLSNYGVKKTLPRLIVVAVLVNISFILCQLAVDVSNILGAGLNELFVNLAGRVSSEAYDLGAAIGGIGDYLMSGVAIGGLLVGGVSLAALTWEYWLVPFLLILLTVVISIIFFFVLLGVRKAGIIILVALAPVAIVCYALPNTKKIFDRWLKMITGLLMVYPICGLLMGGGKFAATLILSNINTGSDDTSFILALVAMLLTAVPFFFIPSLLRSSMAAMGNLGAKISGFGSRLGHGASGAIKRSERVQDWNKRLRVNTQYRRAQRSIARAEKKGRTVSVSQARRIARAKAAYEKQGIEDATNQLYAGRSGAQIAAAVTAAGIAAEDKDLRDAADAVETQYKKEGLDYNLSKLQEAHMDALNALIADPTNREAKARLMAAHNLLSATDPGRGRMKNNFYQATSALKAETDEAKLATGAQGLAWAAQSLHRSQGGNIKSHDRAFEKYLTKAAEGYDENKKKLSIEGNFVPGVVGRDKKGEVKGYVSSYYDTSEFGGYTASSLADVDEGVLDRWLEAANGQNGDDGAKISAEDRAKFLEMSADMLTNENISVQPKIAAKVNAIRKSLGASEITPAVRGTSSTDSGSLNPRTQTTGDVLRTGNDDHAPAQPASAPSAPARPVNPPAQPTSQPPVPNGATVTDSGLVIAHGDMSGEQIRDFARQMDDYNRRQGNNGQNNSSNGQNNRNR